MTHEATQTTLTDADGRTYDAWAVPGTPFVRLGQQGEQPARDEAKRLNRKECDGGEEKPSMANREESPVGNISGVYAECDLPNQGAQEVSGYSGTHRGSPGNEAFPQAPPTQAELAAQYRARIAYHRDAGSDSTHAVARAAKDMPGYVPPVRAKRRKVL